MNLKIVPIYNAVTGMCSGITKKIGTYNTKEGHQ